jgi:hypothetical protein
LIGSFSLTQISDALGGADRLFNARTGARITRMKELLNDGYYVVAMGTAMARVQYPLPDDGSTRLIRFGINSSLTLPS